MLPAPPGVVFRGRDVLVNGCGPVGLVIAQIALALGAAAVVQVAQVRLEVGAQPRAVLPLERPQLVAFGTVADLAGRGVTHLALEASSHGLDQRLVAAALRRRGYRVAVARVW